MVWEVGPQECEAVTAEINPQKLSVKEKDKWVNIIF